MEILRYAAFTDVARGGNPAGIVLDARGAAPAQMLAVAAGVGYSETAFLTPTGERTFDVRYFSPLAEVSFCGHATIASAVALAERIGPGELLFTTAVGAVQVGTETASGVPSATLTSVPPAVADLPAEDLAALLGALGWPISDLDPTLPPRVAYAGAFHPILAAATYARLASVDYDFDALSDLMAARAWTTVDLVWRESATSFRCRNPFPPGGVVEDPATGAAAAAFGGYLRALGLVNPPADVHLTQGAEMGRPGTLLVHIPPGADTGIDVTGQAVPIDH